MLNRYNQLSNGVHNYHRGLWDSEEMSTYCALTQDVLNMSFQNVNNVRKRRRGSVPLFTFSLEQLISLFYLPTKLTFEENKHNAELQWAYPGTKVTR